MLLHGGLGDDGAELFDIAGDVDRLKRRIDNFLADEVKPATSTPRDTASPTLAFRRVVQEAALQVLLTAGPAGVVGYTVEIFYP